MENESVVVRPGGDWTSNGQYLTHDGVHPNSRGEQILADLIAQGIYEALKQ
jgi:lysophospholipase L1-like esterase